MPKKYRAQGSQWMFVIGALFLLLMIPVWVIWIAPHFKKIPENFTYRADILSLDNFYDEELKKFEGEQISKTIFSYEVLANNPNFLIIKNVFAVRKLNDEAIFSVKRLYYINPYNGKHVPGVGEQDRTGYLFAPRYVNKQNFFYWHINYNAPAQMKFVQEDEINGLTVYLYQAHYAADQPGCKQKRQGKDTLLLI